MRMGSSCWVERQNCFGFPQPAHLLKHRRRNELQLVIKVGDSHIICNHISTFSCTTALVNLSDISNKKKSPKINQSICSITTRRAWQNIMFLLRALRKHLPLLENDPTSVYTVSGTALTKTHQKTICLSWKNLKLLFTCTHYIISQVTVSFIINQGFLKWIIYKNT